MAITTDLIKVVREKSGAGMLDCKKALEACDCDVEKACDWLREKGIAKAAKKADRIAAEGLCSIKTEGNKTAILEVNSETDFAAKSAPFGALVAKLTDYVLASEVTTAEAALALNTNEGTVETVLQAATGQIGEKMTLRRCEVLVKTDSQSFGSYIHMGGKIGVLVVLEGNGNLSDRLTELSFIVYATDLIDRGNNRVKPGVDFLKCTELPCNCNIILTNPPFKYATEFAQKALELLPDRGYYIAFMNISYITGQKRYNSIYKNGNLKYFCPFVKRVECWRNNDKELQKGKAMIDFAWYIFKKGYEGMPRLIWLNR